MPRQPAGIRDLERAAEYYRTVAAPSDRQHAAEWRAKAAGLPEEWRGQPTPAYPGGYPSRPRANALAIAATAERSALSWEALADRIECRVAELLGLGLAP